MNPLQVADCGAWNAQPRNQPAQISDRVRLLFAVDRATVRQKKTGQPVRFELTEQTRQAVDDYVRAAAKKPGEFMFTGRPGSEKSITTRQYARLVSEWIACIGLDPHPRQDLPTYW